MRLIIFLIINIFFLNNIIFGKTFSIKNYISSKKNVLDRGFEYIFHNNTSGTILIPAGNYILKKSIQIPLGFNILGEGYGNTFINYKGYGAAFIIKGNIPKMSDRFSILKGFTIKGNIRSMGGILLSNTQGNLLSEIRITNFKKGYGIGFMNSNGGWTENNIIEKLKINNCKFAIKFFQNLIKKGRPSFGYNKIVYSSLTLYTKQVGIFIDKYCNLYNSIIIINIWLKNAQDIIICKGKCRNNMIFIFGEAFRKKSIYIKGVDNNTNFIKLFFPFNYKIK